MRDLAPEARHLRHTVSRDDVRRLQDGRQGLLQGGQRRTAEGAAEGRPLGPGGSGLGRLLLRPTRSAWHLSQVAN